MKYYKTVADLVERAQRGEDVEFLLGQLGIALDRIPVKDPYPALKRTFDSQTRAICKRHKVSPYVIASLYALFRDERDERIQSARVINDLHRDEAQSVTMRRFAGWQSSTPSKKPKREVISFISEPVKELPKKERMVIADQTRKMITNMDVIVAKEAGAIGYYWHSLYRVPGYRYRESHKHLDMDGVFVILRDSWAYQQGLIKKGNQIFSDQIERPGELPNCKCSPKYVYSMTDVPKDCLTIKGLEFTKGV